MALLPATIFQPPLPPLILLIPPSSQLQWLLRLILLCFSLSTIPLIFLLIPLSVILPPSIAPLPLHPHNRPPSASYPTAVLRGVLVYAIGGLVWAITSTGCAPENGERGVRWVSKAAGWLVEGVAWMMGDDGWVVQLPPKVVPSCPMSKKASSSLRIKSRRHHTGTFASDNHVTDKKRTTLQSATGTKRTTEKARLVLSEEEMAPIALDACRGVLASEGLDRRSVTGFCLNHEYTSSTTEVPRETQPCAKLNHYALPSRRERRVFLFLAGGGYVTGFPLVHPFIFSLLRSLPPSPKTSRHTDTLPALPHYAVLAPHIRKSLSLDRAFPIPLLDALAGYAHLRKIGYKPEEVIVIGDSAGGGLVWSLAAYLAAVDEGGQVAGLGVPGGLIMISPWISLPPTPSSHFPDLIDEPQLLNAARCYLARFPLLKHRPDPFRSDLHLWAESVMARLDGFTEGIKRLVPLLRVARKRSQSRRSGTTTTESIEQKLLQPNNHFPPPKSHVGWLDSTIFEHLTSHHPLVSPASDLASPFVQTTLDILANRGTRVYVHAGTAEWFHEPGMAFASAARDAGVNVVSHEEVGGVHIEGCLLPGELGGMSGRLVKGLKDWVLEGEQSM